MKVRFELIVTNITQNRYVPIALIGMSAWCVGKYLGSVAFYSGWFGMPGMERAIANAHLWAIAGFLGAVFSAGAAIILLAQTWKREGDYAPPRYLFAIVVIFTAVCACLALSDFIESSFHYGRK